MWDAKTKMLPYRESVVSLNAVKERTGDGGEKSMFCAGA